MRRCTCIFFPLATQFGFDPVWFAVIVLLGLEISLTTPPFGLLLFVMASISGQKLNAIVREVLPFLVAMLLALALITFFPGLSLWLPRLFGYQG